MDSAKITSLCRRLTVRLNEPCNGFQLRDIATMLVIVQWNLDRAFVAQQGTGDRLISRRDLDTSLRWIQDHASVASTADLRSHVAAALQAASASLSLLPTEARSFHPGSTEEKPFRIQRVRVLQRRQLVFFSLAVCMWIYVNYAFWTWWIRGSHVGVLALFIPMSAAFFYITTVVPSFYIFYLGCMRKPTEVAARRAVETGSVRNVAVITLTVPGSESVEIVKRELRAIAQIRFPHDSWILVDKEHSPEIAALAKCFGVNYFCRHDVARWGEGQVRAWNHPVPPFQEKTKAGNVNAWLDAYGHQYSHFTQFDIDHVPVREYLDKVLGYFNDKRVAWVQGPSVYGNLHHWTARGSAEQEFVLQGPLQMGFYGLCRTPFIIGSHCTYETAAITKIGGFQPTRAEDHLDTVFLAADRREGVFVPEVIAVGDGPETFETYVAQQFAWAYSMIQVLLYFMVKRIKYYTLPQALQFLFVQTWYTLWSTSTLVLFLVPLVSLVINKPFADVSLWQFILHCLPLYAVSTAIWFWSRGWHVPQAVRFSWRGVILHIARWPIVLSALVQVVFRVKKPYMITVKGLHRGEGRPFLLAAYAPYFVLMTVCLLACWSFLSTVHHSASEAYLFFALQGAALMLLVFVIALMKDMQGMVQDGVSWLRVVLLRRHPLLILFVGCVMLTATSMAAYLPIYEAFAVSV